MHAGYERWMKRIMQVTGRYPDEHRLRSDRALYELMLRRRSHRDISSSTDYARLRKFGNIHYLPKDDSYLVIGHNEVDAILQQPDIFPRIKHSRLDPDDLIRFSTPAAYESVMKPLRDSINRAVLHADEQWVCTKAIAMFQDLPTGRDFDLYRRFSMPLTWAITMRLFGFDEEASARFLLKYGLDLDNPMLETGLQDWCGILLQQDPIAADERLLQILQVMVRLGTCTLRDANSLLLLMVHAALRTTSVSLSSMIEGLAGKEGDRPYPCPDEKGIPKYMEEVWRISPPVTKLIRFLTARTEICGIPMIEHTRVVLDLRGANRDPLHFSHPFEISPAHNRHRNLSFSAGLHQCTGMHVARYQVRVILDAIFPMIGRLERLYSAWAETENGNSSTIAPVRQLYRLRRNSYHNGNA